MEVYKFLGLVYANDKAGCGIEDDPTKDAGDQTEGGDVVEEYDGCCSGGS